MKPTAFRLVVLLAMLAPTANLWPATNSAGMAVHEWGTFTSLQDENGQAIGGINTDDEPVPKFVHRLADFLLLTPTEVPVIFFQGAPRCHPDVTLRLETPVLYFHPAQGSPVLNDVNVRAEFRGGWLTEFYPNAEAEAPGVESNAMSFGPLLSSSVSSLAWNNLAVGGDSPGPATTEHVWTSPRNVKAAAVRATDGEAEKFLFYRGVAHIDAPIKIIRETASDNLVLSSQCPPEIASNGPLGVRSLWLVDIKENGQVAFRSLAPVTLDAKATVLAKISARFKSGDYSGAKRENLKKSLHEALVRDGLFDDEAQALLNTWELSYFKSAGLRVFFLLPRAWTDFYLPLSIPGVSDITRVMVGRIELVTPRQREALHQLAQLSTMEITNGAVRLQASYYGRLSTKSGSTQLNQVNDGRESLAAFGVSIPKSYQLYLDLGRFRNALILDEIKRRPSPGLTSFISTYRLAGYEPKGFATAGD